MSNTILTCSGCISGCLWLYLAGGESTKDTDRGAYIVAASIRSICAKDTCIGNTCTMSIWIRCAGVGGACIRGICAKRVYVGSVELKVLARSGVILVGPGVNNSYFLLSIGLIFALTKEVYYWNIGESNSDLINAHIFDVRYIFLYL